MLFCFQIQLIARSAPQHLQCVASATQFYKLLHYGHPVVFIVGYPEGCLVEPLDGSLCFGSFFPKNIKLERTKASVCQTTQSAPFLPSYIITLPRTYTHREHTRRDTHTERHTPTHTMLLHVSKCFKINAHEMTFLLTCQWVHQCLVPMQDTGCLGSVCTRPTPPLGQLTDPPYKVLIFYSRKPWDCPVPSFGIGPSFGTCETWV